MKPRLLGIAPKFDTATEYSHAWFQDLMEKIREHADIQELKEESATRGEFERKVIKECPDYVVFYDHGDVDKWVAQHGVMAVCDLLNVHLLRGKVAYSMSCLSAKVLGARAYTLGARAYVGYYDLFMFTIAEADLFKEAANYGLIHHFKEGEEDWGKVKSAMIEKYNEMIEKAKHPMTKVCLRHDRDALRIYAPEAQQPRVCLLRRIAKRLLGRIGLLIGRAFAVGTALFFLGLGLAIHDFWLECPDPLRWPPHGFWWGCALVVVGYLLLTWAHVKWLRKVYI